MTSLYEKYQRKIDAQERKQLIIEDAIRQQEADIIAARDRIAELKYALQRAKSAQNDLGKQRQKALDAKCRRDIKNLCDKYSLTYDRTVLESYYCDARRRPVTEYSYWVDCPEWLDKDPIDDGHYAHYKEDLLGILETYAKHHPDHPEHDKREFNVISRHV